MKRHLRIVLTALCLLLCAAFVSLWVRGRDQFVFTAGGRLWWVSPSGHGALVRVVGRWPAAVRPTWVADRSTQRLPAVEFSRGTYSSRQWAGVRVERAAVTAVFLDGARVPATVAEYERYTWKTSPQPPRKAPLPLWGLRVPYWLLLAAAGALPLTRAGFAMNRWKTRRGRARRGLCPACGYDLRGSPRRCPECGTMVPDSRPPAL